MDTEQVSRDILEIRNRLRAIEEERDALAPEAFEAKAKLLDEEHELRARLAELQNSLTDTGDSLEHPGRDSRVPPARQVP